VLQQSQSKLQLSIGLQSGQTLLSGGSMMATLTITPEGTLTVPKELIQDIGMKPGEQVEVERLSNGSVILKPSAAVALPKKTGKIEDLFGCLAGKSNVHLTIEEMNEAIGQAIVEEYERGVRR
jgi:AbrB family looped-hinge helix DNA binding protein